MEKDYLKENFIKMIQDSWTYNKLTEKEKENIIKIFNSQQIEDALKGTSKHRWQILGAIYHSFLVALDYNSTNWREKEEVPLF